MNEHYAIQSVISDMLLTDLHGNEYPRYAIEQMKRKLGAQMFEEIFEHGGPVVVETHLESWREPFIGQVKYVLHCRLTAVSTRNVVLPVFTFKNHSGVIEWKCPACGTINALAASYCGEKHQHAVGCGRPRDRLAQDIELETLLD